MDLDSLDALLDAAEIEAVAEDAPSTDPPAETTEEDAGLDDWGAALAEQASATEEADDWGAALSEQAAALDAAPVSTPAPTEAPTQPPTEVPTVPPTLAPTEPPTVAPVAVVTPESAAAQEVPVAHHDEPVSKPTQAKNKQPANTETWTEAEMDSLKKLVIIFGSITIVLILTAIGIGLGGLLSDVKPDPKLVETIEGIKNDVGQAYLVTEDSGKQLKTMGTQLSDVATQLADITESIETLKKAPIIAHATPASTGKPMSASERKAAMREEIQANAANGGEAADNADAGEAVVEKVEKPINYAQVKALSVDILDVKKRLVATQKLLEQINKQSEALQLQSLTLTEAVKAVEVEMKTHNKPPVRVVSSVNKKAIEDKKAEEKPVAPPVQVKPADDPQFRARWSREMGKSDGFP
jgi:hypothetical protein